MKKFLLVGATLVAVGLMAFGLTRFALDRAGAGEETTAATALEPTPSPAMVEEFRQQAEAKTRDDAAKPRFLGQFGDFVVAAPGRANNAQPCAPVKNTAGNPIPSELNLPNMTEQATCADGTVVGVCALSLTPAFVGCRQYFLGKAQVPVDAPLDRLELLDVDGRPALAVHPVLDFMETRLFVIQRAASPSAPGILLDVSASGGLQKAIESARSVMP